MKKGFTHEQMKSAMKLNDIDFKGYWREDEEYIYLQSFLSPKTAAIYDHELKVRREKLEEVMNGYLGGFDTSPFFRICYAEAMNISNCNAGIQRYMAAVVRQPYSL